MKLPTKLCQTMGTPLFSYKHIIITINIDFILPNEVSDCTNTLTNSNCVTQELYQ